MKTLGRILMGVSALGIAGSALFMPSYGGLIKARAEAYLNKTVVPIEQQIEAIETNPIGAVNSDPNLPRDFAALTNHHRALIEKRDQAYKTEEVIKAQKTANNSAFYIAGGIMGVFASGLLGVLGYKIKST